MSFAQGSSTKTGNWLAMAHRRTFLESETKLAGKSCLARAESRLDVSKAAAQLQRAESAKWLNHECN